MLITGCQDLKIGMGLTTVDWSMDRVGRVQKIKGEVWDTWKTSQENNAVCSLAARRPAKSKSFLGTGHLCEQSRKTQSQGWRAPVEGRAWGDPYYTPGNLGISRATAQTLFPLLSPPNSKTPLWLWSPPPGALPDPSGWTRGPL